MSTKGKRDFRPSLHYTPSTGWINDPNGLVYENGRYHLFAQHYPYDGVWGPMHWSHAVSHDLIHWEHLPIALEPDELGYIFSGSAVYDEKNTSGFGKDGRPPIVAMYTSHLNRENGDDVEQQSIAYSTDYVNFTKYEGNPVLTSGLRDFRDPKVIPNPKGGWTVTLAQGDRVVFYHSDNLRDWTKTGEFGPEGNYSEGVWECPDLFPLKAPNGEEKWILLVSMGRNHENHGARTQYFIGQFDGDKFVCTDPFTKAEFIDQSFDNYAGVTYHNTKDRILIAWGTSWTYANDLPTGEFCGTMTMARRLSLVETENGGLRLASTPVENGVFGEAVPCSGKLDSEVFKLTAEGSGDAEISLSNSLGQTFVFGVNKEGEVFIDRSKAGASDFNKDFASDWYSKISAPRFYNGSWKLELIFDRSITELFADYGTLAFTQQLFPDVPYDTVSVTGNAKLSLQSLKEVK